LTCDIFAKAWVALGLALLGAVLEVDNPTVQLALEQLQAGYYIDYSLVLAATTLTTIPIQIVFLLLGRRIVAGIMQGAVKG
jgi:cellobiose transport system permease protein